AARGIKRQRALSVTVVTCLALGIGANAAIFTVMDAVLLRALPVPNPQELYGITATSGRDSDNLFSYPLYQRMDAAVAGTAQLAAFTYPAPMYVPDPGRPPREISGQLVSGDFFRTLMTRPELGRLLNPADTGGSGVAAVVLSHEFWQREFGGARTAVGSRLRVNGVDCEVVGVAPPGFAGFLPDVPPDVWLPLTLQARLNYNHNASNDDTSDLTKPWSRQDGISWLQLAARVPGGAAPAVWGRLGQLISRDGYLAPQSPHWRVVAAAGAKGASSLRRAFSQPLEILLAMVGLMLLIACANVAAMLLARGVSRQREIAIRIALGATGWRLSRQLLLEGFMLSAMAGAGGLALGVWGSQLLTRLAVNNPQAQPLAVTVDAKVLAFLAIVSLLVGVLVSLLPAWRAQRSDFGSGIKSDRGQTARLPFGRALIVGQVALSLVLVASAILFSRSLRALADQNPGFSAAQLLNLRLDFRASGIARSRLPAIYPRLLQAVAAQAGVESAALSECPLPSGCTSASDIYFPGSTQSVNADDYTVSTDYFRTAGIPILAGRGFAASDGPSDPPVVVVNQAFAAKFFPGQSPLGVHLGSDPTHASQLTIVGIVGNARIHNLREPAGPQFFIPLQQRPAQYESSLQVRVAGPMDSTTDAVRRAIASVAPELPVTQVRTGAELLQFQLADEMLLARLSDMFALLAMGLACIGLYGVISYLVARRTSEFGLRLALGARPARLLESVLRDALVLTMVGLGLGGVLAALAARLLAHQLAGILWGVTAMDPASLAIAAALMLLVPALAALVPAARAARVDPLVALRTEA
ncbi:MAG TPA: ADOP family duplicated permease, partial [Terriglobales bacterium]